MHDQTAPYCESGEPIGTITSVSRSGATVRLPQAQGTAADNVRATVGKYVGITTGNSVLVAVIAEVTHPAARGGAVEADAVGQLDLLGELRTPASGEIYFQRGVTDYPAIGDPARVLSSAELRAMFNPPNPNSIDIGQLHQDRSVKAYVDVNAMLSKHFAVLGSTGVGKSSGVVCLLRQLLDARQDLRVILIDPHNEYGRSFEDRARILNPKNLKLPFWLFNLEEIVDVIFRARKGSEEEMGILAELIPIAKNNLAASRAANGFTTLRKSTRGTSYTPDTPVPYRIEDLIGLIDVRMGKLENRASWMHYHNLMTRIETVRNDPRYSFIFDNANVGGDSMPDVLADLFRLPTNGKPMTLIQLAGFPAEVVDSIISVLGRMAFELGLWSDGAAPILFVCEEAHRYAPADRSIGFGPTRKALSRIAKEGRKYGVFLSLVTQRPAELDQTIVSQCSTIFAMRLANDRDQAIVKAAVSDAGSRMLEFVSSLGTREVFAFGEGVALPTRLHFMELPQQFIPRGEALGSTPRAAAAELSKDFLASVVERWRGASMSNGPKFDDGSRLMEQVGEALPRERPSNPPAGTLGPIAKPAIGAMAARQPAPSFALRGR
jgi:DNA helicase HerA-like ATPase